MCHIFVDHVQLDNDILEDLRSCGPSKRVGIFVGSPATPPLNEFMYSIFFENVSSAVPVPVEHVQGRVNSRLVRAASRLGSVQFSWRALGVRHVSLFIKP